jgi:hypothetical protein
VVRQREEAGRTSSPLFLVQQKWMEPTIVAPTAIITTVPNSLVSVGVRG